MRDRGNAASRNVAVQNPDEKRGSYNGGLNR